MNATDLLSAQGNLFTYSYSEVIINILLAIILGFIVSVIYAKLTRDCLIRNLLR